MRKYIYQSSPVVLFAALAMIFASCTEGQETLNSPRSDRSLSLSAMGGSAVAPSVGTASDFAVLGGTGDVTLSYSEVTGDVGHFPGTSLVINTGSTVNGTVNADAEQAHADFEQAYADLAALECETTLTGTLAGVTLAPGVYCFDAAATLTGVLTLDGGNDPNAVWIFKVGALGTGALTGTGFSVVMENGADACNVYWWVAEAATMTTSNFQGTILAGAAVTLTGGTFNGDVMSKADVTLTGVTLVGCGSGAAHVPPVGPPYYDNSVKVTGGGQIPVGSGTATFGFNAQPGKSGVKGHLNYVNRASGLHVNGTVESIVVIEVNPDGSPKTVVFSGTYDGGIFVVTVQDNGEPGKNDQFGITVNGSEVEDTNLRVISKGNIQFHK